MLGNTEETLNSQTVSTGQHRIAHLAKQSPEMGLTSLAYHMDMDWLLEAHRRTRKDGAVGVDGQSGRDYEAKLLDNFKSLLDRAKSGLYRAPAVRRAYIPKGDGTLRPLGIPTYEDKVLQRAVAMLLEPVYEQDFLNCSYGFRPGRSAHGALQALWEGLTQMGGGYVVDMDIRKYFDTIDHTRLREVLGRRIRDGVLLRLIAKWLSAGVLEAGAIRSPEAGTPQGGVISPLLSNIYLHEVLDAWFERDVKPRLSGAAFVIRYADDAVVVFAKWEDADRFMRVLPLRFAKYGLTIHPEKTRLLAFARPPAGRKEAVSNGSFDFLGFTHHWGRTRRGRWMVLRKTAKGRLNGSLKKVAQWCKQHRHGPLKDQCQALGQKLLGHMAYYGISGNWRSLNAFWWRLVGYWRKWLGRRSRKGHMSWARFYLLLERYPLPKCRLIQANRMRMQI
jgi:RNA-directed DNA polymerase